MAATLLVLRQEAAAGLAGLVAGLPQCIRLAQVQQVKVTTAV
jgi:hypothetical protein